MRTPDTKPVKSRRPPTAVGERRQFKILPIISAFDVGRAFLAIAAPGSSWRYVYQSGKPVFDVSGQPLYISGQPQDGP
jgi:hypothetical protein